MEKSQVCGQQACVIGKQQMAVTEVPVGSQRKRRGATVIGEQRESPTLVQHVSTCLEDCDLLRSQCRKEAGHSQLRMLEYGGREQLCSGEIMRSRGDGMGVFVGVKL